MNKDEAHNEIQSVVEQYSINDPTLLATLRPTLEKLQKEVVDSSAYSELKAEVYQTILEKELHKDLEDMPWEELEELGSDPVASGKLSVEFVESMQEENVDKDTIVEMTALAELKPKIDQVIEENAKLMQKKTMSAWRKTCMNL